VAIDLDGMAAEPHDALVAAMGLSGQPAAAVPGPILHASGPTPTGWRVLDVWASAADLERCQRERLRPAAQVGGLPRPRVQVTPVHHLQQ